MTEDGLIPPQMLIVLELLPSCGMNFRHAGVKAGCSPSYARKLVGRFAHDKRLQNAPEDRMKRLLDEAGESGRLWAERVPQGDHFRHHPISGVFLTGRTKLMTLR